MEKRRVDIIYFDLKDGKRFRMQKQSVFISINDENLEISKEKDKLVYSAR